MKKAYVVMLALAVFVFAGCAIKFNKPAIPAMTGEVLSGTETVSDQTMEDVTEMFDSGEVATLPGSEGVSTDTGVVAEVDELIEERKTQSGDDTKLTEEDIDLMEQIIQKVQDLGK